MTYNNQDIRIMNRYFFSALFILTASCSQDNGSTTDPVISSGLKIFATLESHVGDFANDPTLSGSNGIEKADSFCANSQFRPDNATYKALLVDGINRDAVSLQDWVLHPNTTYYRIFDNITIGTTSNLAIFDVLSSPLTNSIEPAFDEVSLDYVWTGIGDVSNFSAGDTCNQWTDHSGSTNGVIGIFHEVNRAVFHPANLVGSTCDGEQYIYCVEQPN
jgi:hypothetical protein